MSLFEMRNNFKNAKWTNGQRIITGKWTYLWAADLFIIILDRPRRRFEVIGDAPEWGQYKLIRDVAIK